MKHSAKRLVSTERRPLAVLVCSARHRAKRAEYQDAGGFGFQSSVPGAETGGDGAAVAGGGRAAASKGRRRENDRGGREDAPREREGGKSIHVLNALASGVRLSIGQLAVESKSNEITHVSQLLRSLDLRRCIVTADALNTQVSTVQTIAQGKGGTFLPLKANHPTHRGVVAAIMRDVAASRPPDLEQVEKGHGRLETRRCWVTPDLSLFLEKDKWPGLRTLVRIDHTRRFPDGRETNESALCLSSLPADAPASPTPSANTGASKTNATGASTSTSARTPAAPTSATPRATSPPSASFASTSCATALCAAASASNAPASPSTPPSSKHSSPPPDFYAFALSLGARGFRARRFLLK